MIRTGVIDAFIGVDDFQTLNNGSPDVKISYLESLAIDHLFFNLQKPYLRDKEFRRDISSLVQHVVAKHDKTLPRGLEFQPYFMPRGLLPPSYYRSRKLDFDRSSFVKRWQGRSPTTKLIVVGTVNQLSQAIIKDLESHLADIGISLNYISDFYGKSRDFITSRTYDLCFVSWMGMYPRPEAFLHVLDSGLFADTEAESFFKDLIDDSALIRFQLDSQLRQASFMGVVKRLEDSHYLIPMFRVRTPILHNSQV